MTVHEALQPFLPTAGEPWDFDAAAHLWRRAGFGAPPERIEATLRRAPAEAVDALVRGPEVDEGARDLESIHGGLLGRGDLESFQAWLIARMVRCAHPLREKIALFWHDHFATSVAKVREPVWMMRQYRLFLDRGLGPFGALLTEVARDPAMIRWLDNDSNRKGHPNENFARELLELFTLGVGNYTERDITEAARAFTGWQVLHDRFHFSAALHDDGEKTVLGRTGRFGGEEIVALALEQPACGRFLAAKLIARFVTPEPPGGVVEAFGEVLAGSGYDIAAGLRMLLSSRFFFDRAHRRALVKSPVEFVVGAARALSIPADASALLAPLKEMGQELLAPPNVKGWPGQRAWINTATWLTRLQAARVLTAEWEDGRGIDAMAQALLGGPPPAAARTALESRGLSGRDLARAILALPEAHLA